MSSDIDFGTSKNLLIHFFWCMKFKKRIIYQNWQEFFKEDNPFFQTEIHFLLEIEFRKIEINRAVKLFLIFCEKFEKGWVVTKSRVFGEGKFFVKRPVNLFKNLISGSMLSNNLLNFVWEYETDW